MLSFGMLWARAISITLRSRGLPSGSPPPTRAATLIYLENLLKIVPRLTSSAPLARLTFDHLLCPAMEWDEKNELPERPELRGGAELERLVKGDQRSRKPTGPLNRKAPRLSTVPAALTAKVIASAGRSRAS
jgi:hypothetical protein